MERRYKKMIIKCFLYSVMLNIVCFANLFFSSCASDSVKDDRLVLIPSQDSILGNLILTCKKQSSYNLNPYMDTTTYYMTLNFWIRNDSSFIGAMGSYGSPFIWHDNINEYAHFYGYFLRGNTYCFFYESLDSEGHSSALDKLMNGWRTRDPKENPELFPDEISIQDPKEFVYLIDSTGNYTQFKKCFY